MTLEVFLILAIVLYLMIIGSLVYGLDKVDDFNLSDISPRTKFSIVIPFRNEAQNLPNLLESLSKLNYPHSHFEVILVNDDSNDESVDIINQYLVKIESSFLKNIKIIDNVIQTNSPKKDAITLAIKNTSFDWIVTTDADCIAPRFWLDSFDQIIQSVPTEGNGSLS